MPCHVTSNLTPLQSGVFGLPDSELGEVCVGLISSTLGQQLDCATVAQWANSILQHYK